jgi:ankyrin repeat protein
VVAADVLYALRAFYAALILYILIPAYSHHDIAAFLGLSAAMANNRLRSARKRLQREMAQMAKRELTGQAPSRDDRFARRVADLLQPESMKTERYQYGVEQVDGHQAWALFCASGVGDLAEVGALLDRDPRLVNAQYWYQFPIHMAVREGRAEVVQLLLEKGADPGQSRYTYNSWDKLLAIAEQRGYDEVQALLVQAMCERFGYDPGFDALVAAVKDRDRARVEAVLAAYPDLIRASDALGNNPLHWAALTRQNDLIDYFIEQDANLEARRADGQTPLLVALNGDYWYRSRDLPADAPKGPWVVVRHLLDRGADYALSVACAAGDGARVDEILRADPAQARQLDAGKRSPLSYAAAHGHTALVAHLLDLGADPNRPEENAPRGKALFEACAGNHLETAQLLLDRGADVHAGVDSSGTCLTIVEAKHPQRAQKMQALLRAHGAVTPSFAMDDADLMRAIEAGVDTSTDDQLLHELMGRDNPALIRAFLDRTTDAGKLFQLTDIWGGNCPSDPETIRLLVDHGLDVNCSNWIGRTLLHGCAEKGDIAAARTCLELGADIGAIELEHGSTPLAAAARKGQLEMVRFLLEQGADPCAPADATWAQPLAAAENEGHADVVALLEGARY